MRFKIVSPIKAYVLDYTELELESLTKSLSYVNTANKHTLKRHYTNHWLKNKNKAAWDAKLEELKSLVDCCLVFKDDNGVYVRPGSLSYLEIPESSIKNEINYPKFKKVAWAKKVPFEPYPYQKDSVEKLMEIKHGSVELTTGSGKSNIITNLLSLIHI